MRIKDVIVVNKSLCNLDSVCRSWLREIAKFEKVMDGSYPCWWFNERTNIGILSSAVSKLKEWVSLEEYSSRKCPLDENGEKRDAHGRCDLYISTKDFDYAIEFKQAWQPIFVRKEGRFGKIEAGWRNAWRDIGEINSDEAEKRLSGVFILPYLPKNQSHNKEKINTALDKVITYVKNMEGVGIVGLYLNTENMPLGDSGKNSYPGIILALRERKRSGRPSKKFV